jgi:hypothetical protein
LVKMQELLYRVDFSIFQNFDPKFGCKNIKLPYGNEFSNQRG